MQHFIRYYFSFFKLHMYIVYIAFKKSFFSQENKNLICLQEINAKHSLNKILSLVSNRIMLMFADFLAHFDCISHFKNPKKIFDVCTKFGLNGINSHLRNCQGIFTFGEIIMIIIIIIREKKQSKKNSSFWRLKFNTCTCIKCTK